MGVYDGGVEIDVPNLKIEGAGTDAVFILTPDYGVGFHVTTDGVVLSDMAITGGQFGVHFEGTEDVQVQGGGALDLSVSDLAGTDGTGGQAAGVHVQHAQDVVVLLCGVFTIQGGEGKAGSDPPGGIAGTGGLGACCA